MRFISYFLHIVENFPFEKLELLKDYRVFIIQKRTEIQCLGFGSVSHEIMDHNRNVILKASRAQPLFSGKKSDKILVKNRRNVKLFEVVIEPTNNMSGASVSQIINAKN